MNYVSALKFYFCQYQILIAVFKDHFVKKLMRDIQYSVWRAVVPKGLLLSQIGEIARICEIYETSLTYTGVCLLPFNGLFHISNIAPSSSKMFDPVRHFLCHDIRLRHSEVHVTLKRAKNLQTPVKMQVAKLLKIRSYI